MTHEAEAVDAAIKVAPDEAFREMARLAQRMARAEYQYQQRCSLDNWTTWKEARHLFEQAGLAYAKACAGVFK